MKRLWDKLMQSNILPIVWGFLFVTAITGFLFAVIILVIKWILYLVGVAI